MADERARIAVKIVDPTTNANEVGVDASGNLQVKVNAALPAGSNNIGDVDVLTLPPEAHQADYDSGAGTDTTLAFGIAVPASGGAAVVPGDATAGLTVQLGAALPAGSNNIGDVDILSAPTGASAIEIQGPAADGAAAVGGPLQMGGVDGAGNVQRLLADSDGHLQIDVLSGGGETTPSNPIGDAVNSTNTAAGASANLDSAVINGQEYLGGADISASVPFKYQIQTVAASTTTLATGFGRAGEVVQWRPPHRHYAGLVGDNVDDVFRAVVTNMDNSKAADLYAAFFYQDN